MKTIFETFNEFSNKPLPEKLILATLFLLPIFSLSIRHWLSGFFTLAVLFSLVFVWKRKEPIYKEEKILLIIFGLFLFSFFLSATLNDWTDASFRRVGNVMKYVAFIPLFLYLREYKNTYKYLLYGVVLGGIVLGLQALYDTIYTDWHRANGIYGPIIFGDLSVLFFCFIFLNFIHMQKTKAVYLIYIIALICSVLAIYLSGNRNAWIAISASLLILPFLTPPKYLLKTVATTYGVLTLVFISAIYLAPATIQERAGKAMNEFTTYMNPDTRYSDFKGSQKSSVGFRLEQWRVALLVIKEKPLLGFGGGNAGKQINRYAKQGLAHKDMYNEHSNTGIGGLHSTYFETLVNEGLFGIMILAFLFLYPLYIFIKYRKSNPLVSSLGIILIINYMVFGISENPLVHDNFTSVFLITLAVLFSSIVYSRHNNSINQQTIIK